MRADFKGIVRYAMGHKEGTGRLATLRVYSERPRELFRRVDIDPSQLTGAASLAPEMHQATSTIARCPNHVNPAAANASPPPLNLSSN